jgi:hypothetical protein
VSLLWDPPELVNLPLGKYFVLLIMLLTLKQNIKI